MCVCARECVCVSVCVCVCVSLSLSASLSISLSRPLAKISNHTQMLHAATRTMSVAVVVGLLLCVGGAGAQGVEPPTWPDQLHMEFVTTRAGNLSWDSLYYDWNIKRNFILIKHQQPIPDTYDLQTNSGNTYCMLSNTFGGKKRGEEGSRASSKRKKRNTSEVVAGDGVWGRGWALERDVSFHLPPSLLFFLLALLPPPLYALSPPPLFLLPSMPAFHHSHEQTTTLISSPATSSRCPWACCALIGSKAQAMLERGRFTTSSAIAGIKRGTRTQLTT